MKRAIAIALMAASANGFAATDTQVRKEVIKLTECMVYHQAVYPLYTGAYVNTAGLMYHKNGLGVLRLDSSSNKRILEGAAKRFDAKTTPQKGADLITCQQFLGKIIADNDLVNYGKRLQAQ